MIGVLRDNYVTDAATQHESIISSVASHSNGTNTTMCKCILVPSMCVCVCVCVCGEGGGGAFPYVYSLYTKPANTCFHLSTDLGHLMRLTQCNSCLSFRGNNVQENRVSVVVLGA